MKQTIACAVLLFAALSCTDSEATELVVLVNSDFQPETELAQVHVAIAGTGESAEQRWNVVRSGPADGEVAIPFSFGIEPPKGDESARVDVVVSGLGPDKATLVRRHFRVGFVPHQLRLLKVELTHDCAEKFDSCEAKGMASAPRTCVDGKCASIDVDVHDLRHIKAGEELAGVKPLTWKCTFNCDVADVGSDAGIARYDAGDHDASELVPQTGSHGRGAKTTKGSASETSSETKGAATEKDDDDGDYGGEDAGEDIEEPVTSCGGRPGFFGDVARPLTTTADGMLCPTVAQNRLVEGASVEESTITLTGLIDSALDSELDIVELWVAQSGSTLYATGRGRSTTVVPELGSVLDYTPLRDSDRPLKLNVTEVLPSADEFAAALLTLLLSKQGILGRRYATECRPVYLMADTWQGNLAVAATRTLLASDSTYAALRGHVHFGGYIGGDEVLSTARQDVDNFAIAGFEFVDIETYQPNLVPLARRAKADGLRVFAREAVDFGFYTPLCGLVAAIESPVHSWRTDTNFREGITTSRTLLALDVYDVAIDATQVSYSVLPAGTTATRLLTDSNPSLVGGNLIDPLPGTALAFDTYAHQHLLLSDSALPANFNKMAILAVFQVNPESIPNGGRAVIASKLQGMTGWALELVNTGTAKELRFEAWLRYNPDSSVHVLTAAMSADALSASASYFVLAQIDRGAQLRLNGGVNVAGNGVEYDYSVTENDSLVTIGSDPDGKADSFDGKLQLLKIISYTY